MDAPAETAAPEIVEALIRRAESARASDVHLQTTRRGVDISFRLDGRLCPVESHDRPVGERILGRIKYLAGLQTWRDATPQDGRIPKEEGRSRHDIRVATYPTITGEKIVLRLFEQPRPPGLADLNHQPEIAEQLIRFLARPSGMLLLTGPSGSGKTTTIYACLSELAKPGDRHIITIEDPVEQVLDGVMQTEVNEAQGLTYPKAARHLLRQDPQVLVLGEIRDDETAQIAVRTALTGHQIITTLHAGSCRGVLQRLWTMTPDPFTTSGAVSLIVNQRLLRKLCDECRGDGCERCLDTGFRGRLPVGEWVRFDDALRERLRVEGPDAITPSGTGLRAQADQLARDGLTTPDEVRRVLGEEAE